MLYPLTVFFFLYSLPLSDDMELITFQFFALL